MEDLAGTMMPYLTYLMFKSQKVTLKGGIDLDGSIVRFDGTFDPNVFFNGILRNRISLDIRSNVKFDDVSTHVFNNFIVFLFLFSIFYF